MMFIMCVYIWLLYCYVYIAVFSVHIFGKRRLNIKVYSITYLVFLLFFTYDNFVNLLLLIQYFKQDLIDSESFDDSIIHLRNILY